MFAPRSRRTEAVCLLLGGLLGAGVAWARLPASSATGPLWSVATSVAPLSLHTRDAAGAGSSSAPDRSLQKLAALRKTAGNWRSVVAAFRGNRGDPVHGQELLLELNARAVGQLAREVIGWPDSGRNKRFMQAVYRRWGELDPPWPWRRHVRWTR